jgi:predicted AAA+ superfamily ATPase
MGRFTVNKVSVDIQNFLYYVRGIKKSGKSTLFRDLILELFGTPEKGLLIAIKDELGYKALDNLQVEHTETWQDFEALLMT